MYKLISKRTSQETQRVLRLSDGASIPFDPANTDAVEFAKWLQAGNKPAPAEESGVVTDEWIAETIRRLLPNG